MNSAQHKTKDTQDPITIYHNPRCSKSREALRLIEAAGHQPRIIHYLEAPPTKKDLEALTWKLKCRALDLVRTKEDAWAEYAGKSLTDDDIYAAIARHPVLLERPIVLRGERAAIGRPPELINALL